MAGAPNPRVPPRTTAIDGVLVQDLSWYSDQRGSLSVLLRADSEALFGERFGQAYVTTVFPGVVKAWHRHARQSDRMVGLVGQTLLVLMDGRDDSPTHGQIVEVALGARSHCLVTIPAGVWHGFKNVGPDESMVLNLPDRAYDPDAPDEQRADPRRSPAAGLPVYDWTRHDG